MPKELRKSTWSQQPRDRRKGNQPPAVIDLFSGVGGLSLGAARAGFEVVAAVELDRLAAAAHRLNFPRATHMEVDLSTVDGNSILSEVNEARSRVVGVIGGPPCQGFSCIGGRDEADPRNLLFGHFFRLVSEIKPAFFLAENVPGILKDANRQVMEMALARVQPSYTLLQPITIDAKDYGVPQRRRRVFFVGYRSDESKALQPADFCPGNRISMTTVGLAH